jgi:trehalose 6-phosphate synthase/phosphatase
MRRLRQRVLQQDIYAWARSFVIKLAMGPPPSMAPTPHAEVDELLVPMNAARALRLLIDYDGTLVPIVSRPALAVPDRALLDLLEQLAATEGVTVEIVSGRSRETLDRWLGSLPIALWAEHGFWYRPSHDDDWEAAAAPVPAEWLDKIESILQQFATDTPGAEVERKSASAAWHYRCADPEFGVRQAHELRMLLGDTLANQPFEVLEGKKVIEVRLRGVGKANVARRLHDIEPGTLVVAFGDDRTDEDMFRALPAPALTIAVGDRPGGARYRLDDHLAVRELLTRLAAERRPALPGRTSSPR